MLRLFIVSLLLVVQSLSAEMSVKKIDFFTYIVNGKKFNIKNKKELKLFHKELNVVKKKLIPYEKEPKKHFSYLNSIYFDLTEALKFSQNRKLRYDSYTYFKRHIKLLKEDKDYKKKQNQSYLVSTYSAFADTIIMLQFNKKFDEALMYQGKALDIIKKNPGIVELYDEAFANATMSSIYFEKYYREKNRRGGLKTKSHEYLKKGLVFAQKNKNIYEIILTKNDIKLAMSYQQIALMNKELSTYKNLKQAKKYQVKALEIIKKRVNKTHHYYKEGIMLLKHINNMLNKVKKS